MKPLSHLDWLEAESVYILREVAAECRNPVLLYSIGKDSSVLLHLAAKAFYPGRIPFPVLHIDTTWKFRDMIAFRDRRAAELGLRLIVHTNRDGLAQGIDPFRSGSRLYTDVMKTQALRQALDLYGFDAAIGGARRDEETHIFTARAAAPVGSAAAAARALAALQYAARARRERARVSTLQLDRARRLDVRRARGNPDRAALFCRRPAGRAPRRHSPHAG
jgi:3'-phosphoadenosine 5'-phosphosulfate sulfotransferase (PAPS reductase)/FAD synthetase